MDFIKEEWNVDTDNESEVLSAVYDQISEDYNCDYENAKTALNKYDFNLFTISIEPGYYEGFYINIKLDVWYFDDYTEKMKAQKEVTKIRAFLEEAAGMGFVECSPGWCTTFYDYNATMDGIADAIKEMRLDVKDTPTYYQTQVMKHGGKVA